MIAFAARSFALVVLATGCASSLRAPAYVAQPTSALAEVPYPPPPARVERVPPAPSRNATWIDGEWSWRGGGAGRWLWMRGRWVVPPRGARFSPWTLVRAKDGTLWEAEGTWRDAKGVAVDPPPALAEATVSEGAVVDQLGELHAAGRTLHAPGARPRNAKGGER